jgi:hypothetical protein
MTSRLAAFRAVLLVAALLLSACGPGEFPLTPGPGHTLRVDAIEPVCTSGDDTTSTRTEFYLLYTDQGTFATSIQGSRRVKEGEVTSFYAESHCAYANFEGWQVVTPEQSSKAAN